MSLFRPYSKYLPGVLLLLLFVMVLLVFKSFYNHLLSAGINKTPVWGVIFLVLIAFTGIIFYVLILNERSRTKSYINEIETLRARVDEGKAKKEVKKETVQKEKIDIEKETKSLIPSEIDDIVKFGEVLLLNCARRFQTVQGLFYLKNSDGVFCFKSGYAFFSETEPVTYREGETLAGQVAKNKSVLNLSAIPDNYVTVLSGLGDGAPKCLLLVPIISPNNETIGMIELASFKSFSNEAEELFTYIGHKLGEKLNQSTNP